MAGMWQDFVGFAAIHEGAELRVICGVRGVTRLFPFSRCEPKSGRHRRVDASTWWGQAALARVGSCDYRIDLDHFVSTAERYIPLS